MTVIKIVLWRLGKFFLLFMSSIITFAVALVFIFYIRLLSGPIDLGPYLKGSESLFIEKLNYKLDYEDFKFTLNKL